MKNLQDKPSTTSIRLIRNRLKQIDKIAEVLDTSRNDVLEMAIYEFLDRRNRVEALIRSAVEGVRGKTSDDYCAQLREILSTEGPEGYFKQLGIWADYDIYLQNPHLFETDLIEYFANSVVHN